MSDAEGQLRFGTSQTKTVRASVGLAFLSSSSPGYTNSTARHVLYREEAATLGGPGEMSDALGYM